MGADLPESCEYMLFLGPPPVNRSDTNLSQGNLVLRSCLPRHPPPVIRRRQGCVCMCARVCIFVCMPVCVFAYECGATVGHLDAALCHPLVALLCFAQETGRGEDV